MATDVDKKLPRRQLAHRVQLMEAIERKSDVLMSGEHTLLPDKMDLDQLEKELSEGPGTPPVPVRGPAGYASAH